MKMKILVLVVVLTLGAGVHANPRHLRSESGSIWNTLKQSLENVDRKAGEIIRDSKEAARGFSKSIQSLDVFSSAKSLGYWLHRDQSASNSFWKSILNIETPATKVKPESVRALVRPFCTKDFVALEKSFEDWDVHTPCYFKRKGQVVDLLLYYSRDIHAPEAAKIWERMKTLIKHLKTREWMKKCFDDVQLIDAHLDERRDVYRPSEIDSNDMWNNGPNEQFEIVVTDLIGMEKYELFYYMEPDSVPVTSYWLENLWTEVEESTPFAVLGSKYIGDRWDDFRDQLPLGMQHHLNGNAVYNLSHPLLQRLQDDLVNPDSEFTSSYDLRLAELLLEGPEAVGVDALETSGYKASKVIGNYAASISLKGLYSNKISIVHGAKEFHQWPASETISLVVSTWDRASSTDFVRDVSEDHPFVKIVMMTKDKRADGVGAEWDFCEASVESKWFMLTNTYHRLKTPFKLPASIGQGGKVRAVMQYMKESSPICDNLCKERIQAARLRYASSTEYDMDIHPMRTVYLTSHRDEFCRHHKMTFTHAPTANDFLAWLVSDKEIDVADYYVWSNIESVGYLDQFEVQDKTYGGNVFRVGRALGANETNAPTSSPTKKPQSLVCSNQDTKKRCVKKPFCSWNKWKKKCTVKKNSPTIPTLKPTKSPVSTNLCSSLYKKPCKKSKLCQWRNQKCTVKTTITKKPTKAPTKKPTKAPTKKPTKAPTKSPTVGGGSCDPKTPENLCNKKNTCWFDRISQKCKPNICSSRLSKRYCGKLPGCIWAGNQKCKPETCSNIRKSKTCTQATHCTWQGNKCKDKQN